MTEIELVQHSDIIQQLTELYSASFAHGISEKFWRWKYIENPLSSDKIVVALENGEIVGARPFMLAEMWLEDKKVKAALHCDTMVHPKHQRKGIFSKMGKFAIQHLREQGFALSYGFPNLLSRSGFIKQGYRKVAGIEIIFKLVNSRKLISSRFKNRVFGKTASFLYDRFLNWGNRVLSPESEDVEIEVVDEVNKEVVDVFDLRGESVIDFVRSENFLRWRFDSHPEYRYKYILAKKNNQLMGCTVISSQEKGDGLVEGFIVDHKFRNPDIASYQALIDRSFLELEKQNCDIINIWTWGEPELKKVLLEKFGCKSSVKFPYNRLTTNSYMDAIQIAKELPIKTNIYNEKNWRVTYAFHDVI